MKSLRGTLKKRNQCAHEQTTNGVVAGMERLVCKKCGHVSVKLLSDSITRGGIPSPRYEVDTR